MNDAELQPADGVSIGSSIKRKLEEPLPEVDEEIDGSEIENDEDEEAIQNEYRLWKKNTPFLYDTVLTHCLTWPSLSCEWLPDKSEPSGSEYAVHKLILGTQTSDGLGNSLLIASVKLPKDEEEIDVSKYDESAQQDGLVGGRIQVTTQISHPGEVNKARYCPINPFLIATKTVSGDVLLFDYSKHPSKPTREDEVCAQATLAGHTQEGFALDWQHRGGLLASGAQDGIICVWNATECSGGTDIQPIVTLNGTLNGGGSIEGVAWNYFQSNTLLSVGDDRRILMWDIRNGDSPVGINSEGHTGDINSVTASPHTEFLFATASGDKTIKLWDARRMDLPIHTLEGCHTSEVCNVIWSTSAENMLTSSGNDRRIILWDLSRIGGELSSEEAADGPPELVFIHCGHTGKVTDFATNPNNDHTIASVAEDNILQIWKVNNNVYSIDSDDEAAE